MTHTCRTTAPHNQVCVTSTWRLLVSPHSAPQPTLRLFLTPKSVAPQRPTNEFASRGVCRLRAGHQGSRFHGLSTLPTVVPLAARTFDSCGANWDNVTNFKRRCNTLCNTLCNTQCTACCNSHWDIGTNLVGSVAYPRQVVQGALWLWQCCRQVG